MEMQFQESFTPKRKEALVRQLTDEFVVYEKETQHAHCLNKTAGDVWLLCDGKTTIAEMTQKFGSEAVYMSLQRLEKAGLLEAGLPASEAANLARRDMMRKVGIAAAIAIPVIFSVSVPTPAQAAS